MAKPPALSHYGVPSQGIASTEEIKAGMLDRLRGRNRYFDDFNAVAGELEQFYQRNATPLFHLRSRSGASRW